MLPTVHLTLINISQDVIQVAKQTIMGCLRVYDDY